MSPLEAGKGGCGLQKAPVLLLRILDGEISSPQMHPTKDRLEI